MKRINQDTNWLQVSANSSASHDVESMISEMVLPFGRMKTNSLRLNVLTQVSGIRSLSKLFHCSKTSQKTFLMFVPMRHNAASSLSVSICFGRLA
jgi:hypothetical protein